MFDDKKVKGIIGSLSEKRDIEELVESGTIRSY